jgi:hypothetical protein
MDGNQIMRLSDFEELNRSGVMTFGDLGFRGKCPSENQEQVTFFNRLRSQYSDTFGKIAIHPRNEGLRKGAQIKSMDMHKAEGMTAGASDIIIPARVTFVCELKRRDYTQCSWQDGQMPYLSSVASLGGFACVAFGVDAAWQALGYWQEKHGL